MKLHGYWRSSATYRVRIALALKGLAFELVVVPIVGPDAANQTESFRAKNPMSQVPVLEVEHAGRTAWLAQSVAILEYLEETHPSPALLPRDPILRAKTRQIVEMINSGIQPLQNTGTLHKVKADLGGDPDAWARAFIHRGLTAVEAVASEMAGAFAIGDAPTLADCVLVPQLFNARRYGLDVGAEFPRLARVDARCAELDAFRAAHPDRQPDAVAS